MTIPEDMTAIPYEEWHAHPWLSHLTGATDMETDSAWFYVPSTAPAPLAALDRIIVQESKDGHQWEDSIRADRGIFPSRDWATAAVGWYQRIWGFMDTGVTWTYQALVPSRWDCATVPPDFQEPTCGYFTDWRSRTWTCSCGWAGTNETALVFANDEVVSIACPACAHGLAFIDRTPSQDEVAAAAEAGNPEALTILDPGTYANDYVTSPTIRRFVTGHESEVVFRDRDQFFGVVRDWLLPRLRLDARIFELDLDPFDLMIALDNELIGNLDLETVLGGQSHELCSYGDGGIVGGRTDILGGWIKDWAPEVRHRLTRLGADERPDRDMALAKIVEGMDGWWPQEGDLFEVTSPFLDPLKPADVQVVLNLAGDAEEVTLNGVHIGP
jgi:hypothetical protein